MVKTKQCCVRSLKVPKEQHQFFCQLENQISLLRLVHVARNLQPGDPSAEEILAVIGELAAGSEARIKNLLPHVPAAGCTKVPSSFSRF